MGFKIELTCASLPSMVATQLQKFFQMTCGPVHFSYNPSFSACFFNQNSIFLSQQISQNSIFACFSAKRSEQGPHWATTVQFVWTVTVDSLQGNSTIEYNCTYTKMIHPATDDDHPPQLNRKFQTRASTLRIGGNTTSHSAIRHQAKRYNQNNWF